MKNLLLISAALIVLDQATKHLARYFVADGVFVVIPGVVSVAPFHNTYLGWLGWWAGVVAVPSPVGLVVALHIFYAVLVVVGYRYFCFISQKNRALLDAFFVLAVAGAGGAFIDAVVFGGSWDFIFLFGVLTVDLKDIYIFANIILLFIFGALLVPQYLKLNEKQREQLSFISWAKRKKKTG